ncbi:hypothetical protein BHE74_00035831 [Ensete ventricosum]|nr:hypothetical protein BHE74_00035831 [Ensete ventricosum]RZS10523.1 hypothetical protein BHM03_00041760 [Ensete ventricosum]
MVAVVEATMDCSEKKHDWGGKGLCRSVVAWLQATTLATNDDMTGRGRIGQRALEGDVGNVVLVMMLPVAEGETRDGSGIGATAMIAEDKATQLLQLLGKETREVATVDDIGLRLGIEEEEGTVRVEGSCGVVAGK